MDALYSYGTIGTITKMNSVEQSRELLNLQRTT